jgi:hypothetical protein
MMLYGGFARRGAGTAEVEPVRGRAAAAAAAHEARNPTNVPLLVALFIRTEGERGWGQEKYVLYYTQRDFIQDGVGQHKRRAGEV